MRRVKLTKRVWNQKIAKWEWVSDGDAFFHQWGFEGESDGEGGWTNSVAILERDDGSVLTKEPHEITFMEKTQ